MADELTDPRVLDPRTRRRVLGTYEGWRSVAPLALVLAALFYLSTALTETTVVQLTPTDSFEWIVFLSGILLAGYVGYSKDGVALALFAVGSVWFGSTYYGATHTLPDIANPSGLFLVVFVAVLTSLVYGVPSYVAGRILRSAVEYVAITPVHR